MPALLISDNFPPKTGGSGRWFWEVYGRLPRTDYVIAAGEDPRQDDFDRAHDLRVARVPLAMTAWGLRSWRGLAGYGRALQWLRRVARKHRVTQVHAARCLPEGWMALCLKWCAGLPYVCYAHGEDITCASESRELRWMARRVAAGAAAVIANSRNTARLARDHWGVGPDMVHVLHPGVDTNRFRPAPPDPAARTRLGWGDRPVVLTVGRLQKRKGHDQMILALRAVRQTVPDVLYAIVGDGEERASLGRLVAENGLTHNVVFHGECDDADLITCYQQCDVFALPNRQVGQDIEGFGMVLLEAQACGKPVIAGDSGGTVETMHVPETGWVVNCDGPDLLAEAVTELLTRPEVRLRMGGAGRQWAVERFDWAALSHDAADLFRRAKNSSAADSLTRSGAAVRGRQCSGNGSEQGRHTCHPIGPEADGTATANRWGGRE